MHAVPEVTGEGLINYLEKAAAGLDIYISCNLQIINLVRSNSGKILGAVGKRPDGTIENISAQNTILACNGYGGNPTLISENIPEMKDAIYFGAHRKPRRGGYLGSPTRCKNWTPIRIPRAMALWLTHMEFW